MQHRSIQDIFPSGYPDPLDERDVRRKCSSHIELASQPEHVYWWINKIACPFKQEAYAEGMRQELQERLGDPDDDIVRSINSYTWEDIMHRLDLIIRKAQVDELHVEMLQTDEMTPVHAEQVSTNPTFLTLQHQIEVLQEQVQSIIEDKTQNALLWPMYTAQAQEDDKRIFENYLKQLCHTQGKSMTAQVKNYLKMKKEAGLIKRPLLAGEEWTIVRQFGYNMTKHTYQNCHV